MTATTNTDDGIEWYYDPIDDCTHDPIPATIGVGRVPIDCPICGAAGDFIPR
ncbi:hypothetical protein [Natronoglomus mannanivorans]|uniref:Uncharacterized protein n=1 Tax=Natronoglomus mannanivorans TaxID=2979990 RepID=A0AAP3E365_9EURY|nr:hypothetical protein [Halobacteria archaeon AArc-xg1-1]